MSKSIIPLQFFGIGDLVFTQTLIHKLKQPDEDIVWPVESQWIEGLKRAYPNVVWLDHKKTNIDFNIKVQTIVGNSRIIPIRWADSIMKVPYKDCMKAKYDMYGQDFLTWKERGLYCRSSENESALYNEVLNITKGEPYNLINEFYQSNATGHVPIRPPGGHNIYMRTIPDFSIFDWSTVIENATEIHTVSTSLFYLLELLDLTQPIHLYARNNDHDFSHIKYLFTKDYILHR